MRRSGRGVSWQERRGRVHPKQAMRSGLQAGSGGPPCRAGQELGRGGWEGRQQGQGQGCVPSYIRARAAAGRAARRDGLVLPGPRRPQMRLLEARLAREEAASAPVVMRKWQGSAWRTSEAVRPLTSLQQREGEHKGQEAVRGRRRTGASAPGNDCNPAESIVPPLIAFCRRRRLLQTPAPHTLHSTPPSHPQLPLPPSALAASHLR